MIGKKLGRFEVVERIDAGGQGEIYRARHEELDLDVAVKVLRERSALDQTARKLFLREAHTLAKLKHPHIGAIHDFVSEDDTDYLVMELVPGTDLGERLQDGGLPEPEVLRLATQIAQALEEAHEQHIVHLDLKPKNIMVTPKGQVKVLDFGLARLVRPIDEATTRSMTDVQRVAGTLPYMAPEQLKDGADVDARTDVYALGATLYEMSTGRRPFVQDDPTKLITAILQSEPTRPGAIREEISSGLERVILKSLAKDPVQRYQTVGQLREDLERCAAGVSVPAAPTESRGINRRTVATATAVVGLFAVAWLLNIGGIRGWFSGPRTHSLAVLPIDNLTGDPEQDVFAEGITDALISRLARIGALKVIGRGSSMQFGRSDKPDSEIGSALGVENLLRGSVTRHDDGVVHVTFQLVDANTGQVLWSDSFTREAKEVLSIHGDVAAAVAHTFGIAWSPLESDRRTVDPSAYTAYVKGEHRRFEGTEESIRQALEFFTEAIEIEPEFAPAHAGLANCWFALGDQILAFESLKDVLPKAMTNALRALQLDPLLAEAQTLLGSIIFEVDKDWIAAEQAYERALELRPSYAAGRLQYGQFLRDLGRYEEALEQIEQAQELDPLNSWIDANVIGTYAEMGLWEEALEAGTRALATNDGDWVIYWILGVTYFWMGEYEQAVVKLEQTREMEENGAVLGWLARAYIHTGRRSEAIDILEQLEALAHPPSIWIACIRADLGEVDVAFDWLEKAYEDSPLIMLVALTTVPSNLRSDPRFHELVDRLGVPSKRGDRLFADG